MRSPTQAAAQLAKAYEYLKAGRLQESGVRDFGYGLTTLASMLMEQGRLDAAVATFQVALQTWAALSGGGSNVESVMEHCRRSLQRLGATGNDEPLPPPFGEPILRLADLLKDAATTSGDIPSDLDTSEGELVDSFAIRDALNAYFEQLTKHFHLSRRAFGKVWSNDLAVARGRLPRLLPSEHTELLDYVGQIRYSAVENTKERRVVSLQAALLNHYLWTKPWDELRSNEPQLRSDLMRYARRVLDEGLRQSSRDLILGSVEAQAAVAFGTPLMALRNSSLLDGLLESVGIYLLLTGPSPARAHEINFDERIFNHLGSAGSDDGDRSTYLRRAEPVPRNLWAIHLLKQWRDGQEKEAATFALASVVGWDRARARWLLERIFVDSSAPAAQQDLLAWQDEVDALLAAVSKVDIVYNPWAPKDTDNKQSSVITSDRAGRLWVPDPVLKAAVARSLETGDAVKVRGESFAGRRMPTYLLTNKHGPVFLLKIDHADRVAREVDNFRRYAEGRLHQRYRPSQCTAQGMEMYLGEDGEPLRAIVTSYAFEEWEEPLTLGSWFKDAQGDEAARAIEILLLGTMRPWITDFRRDRVDLRAEYPVFRPAPAPDKQSPNAWAGSELTALTESLTPQDLDGLALPSQEKRSADSLREGALGLEKAAAQLSGLELINPLWFAARVADLEDPASDVTLDDLIKTKSIDLRDHETLLTLTHGDLHMDNVLCTSAGHRQPQTVLIDFESAHYGHVCKDFARLEACVLTHVFTWDADEAGRIAACVASGADLSDVLSNSVLWDMSERERLVLRTVRSIRKSAFGCGQRNWPIPVHEYQLALAGSLIPMIRSTGMEPKQRQFALTLSTVVCSALLDSWQREAPMPWPDLEVE